MDGARRPSPERARPHRVHLNDRPARAAAVAGLAAAALLAPDVAAAGPPATVERADPAGAGDLPHCVLEVTGVRRTGELVTGEPTCFGTLAEALEEVGVDTAGRTELRMSDVIREGLLASASSFVLGTHYDGSNRTGASITVTGADCGGGYLNLSSTWVNRISSTSNGCGVVRFFDGFDKSGSSEQTGWATVNLGALNNAANSIQYAS